MPLEAVVFDYGHTLVDFSLPEGALRAAYDEIRARLVDEIEHELPSAADLTERVGRRVIAAVDESYAEERLQELDIIELFGEALGAAGLAPSPELARTIAELEHAALARHAEVRPSTLDTLAAIKGSGLRIGIISNAHLLPYMMRQDWDRLGILEMVEASIISSEIGIRKPHPDIFRSLLRELTVEPREAIFVGDRLRDDVSGAQRVGMLGVLTREFRHEDPWESTVVPDVVINRLPEILPLVESLRAQPAR